MDPTKLIEDVVKRIMRNVIFRATVTEVIGGGNRVKIRRVGQSVADGRAYNLLSSYTSPVDQDDVLCIGAFGTVIVLGKIN